MKNHVNRYPVVVMALAFLMGIGISSAFALQTYTMKKGDTLWDLAAKFYGDPTLYKDFLEVNNITNPRTIPEGKVIVIPNLDEIKKISREHDPVKKKDLISKIVAGQGSSSSGLDAPLLGGTGKNSTPAAGSGPKVGLDGIRRDGLKGLFDDSVKAGNVKKVEVQKF